MGRGADQILFGPAPLLRASARACLSRAAVDLSDFHGCFRSGWSPQQIERALGELEELLDVRLACVWEERHDNGTYWGPAEIICMRKDEVYTAPTIDSLLKGTSRSRTVAWERERHPRIQYRSDLVFDERLQHNAIWADLPF